MKVKHITLSYTSLAAWRKSPRRFSYEMLQGLRPIEKHFKKEQWGSALVFGQCIHKFMECWDGPDSFDYALQQALNCGELPLEGIRSQQHLKALVTTYVTAFTPFTGQRELELKMPLSERVTFVAHLDCLTTDDIIVDYKTSSKDLSYDWYNTISPNQQAIGYLEAAKHNGYNASEVLFRGISSDLKLLDPEYQPRKRSGEAKERPPLFLDATFIPSPQQIAEWHQNTLRDINRLIEDIEADVFTCHCSIGDICAYRRLCTVTGPIRQRVTNNDFWVDTFRGFAVEFES